MSYLPDAVDPLAAKRDFAAALLRSPHDTFTAARSVFPDNMQTALFIMQCWVNDPYVKTCQQELLDEFGEEYFLPTAAELAHAIYDTAVRSQDKKNKIDAFRLYAEVRGFIAKPTTLNVNNSVAVTQNVLSVEQIDKKKFAEQQRLLRIEAAEDAS